MCFNINDYVYIRIKIKKLNYLALNSRSAIHYDSCCISCLISLCLLM